MFGRNICCEVSIDIGKGFQVAFWMPRWDTAVRGRAFAKVAIARTVDLRGLIEAVDEEGVRLHLVPLEAAFFTVDTYVERVFFAY